MSTIDSTPTGNVSIEEEMRRSYLDYAMSVIVARALPDVRDGLKPVHRRILHTMREGGYDWSKPYRKSARIVGDVMGQYHPHGDSAIYDAMVRMAQDFSMRLPLIDGQGNFGSMDGDPAAAMRYTEARLARSAEALLRDIDKDTVDFVPNYDESQMEPSVLPAEYPNLLVNGAGGIAVGMATNIPPHNLGEVIDACCAYMDNPGITIDELMEIVPGPDFPTGGLILGRRGIRDAYHTGRGSITMRGRATIEGGDGDRQSIVITEVPYQVNKARMVERIAEVVRAKQVEGVADLRDESDRQGVRVVVDLKRDAMADVVLNQLYRFTPLQTSFGVNMLALNGGRPELMSLRDVIVAFIRFREEVIQRRTKHLLNKARERAHLVAGLLVALGSIDRIIAIIRGSKDANEAREALMAPEWPAAEVAPYIALIDDPLHRVIEGRYRLSEAQAKAILDLRLQRLTAMERGKLEEEMSELATKIEDYLFILENRDRRWEVMREELIAVRERFADDRRTTLEMDEFEQDIESLIVPEEMVVTVSHAGYIKRVPLSTYRAQRRGGKGRAGMATRDEDFVSRIFVANMLTPLLFFTSRGMVHRLKVYRLPQGTPTSRGKAMVNLLPLAQGETISTVMPMPDDEESWGDLQVIFATSRGNVRRNRLSDFTDIRANGKIAMKFEGDNEGDRLIGVATCHEAQDVLLATRQGKCIRFQVGDVRVFAGRSSVGVRGIRLADGDEVMSLSIIDNVPASADERDAYVRWARKNRGAEAEDDENGESENGNGDPGLSPERIAELEAAEAILLTIASDGFGKRSSAYEYRVTGRGGQGIANIELERSGGKRAEVVATFPIGAGDQLMLVTDGGQLIRCPTDDISIVGRRSRGVTVFRLGDGERVVSAAALQDVEGEEENGDGEETADAGESGTTDATGVGETPGEEEPAAGGDDPGPSQA